MIKEFESWWPEKRVDAMRESAANYVELRELTRVTVDCGADLESLLDAADADANAADDELPSSSSSSPSSEESSKQSPPPPPPPPVVTVADCRMFVQMFERCAPILERKERTLDADDRKYADNKLPASRPFVVETKRATLHLARRHMRVTLRLMATTRR